MTLNSLELCSQDFWVDSGSLLPCITFENETAESLRADFMMSGPHVAGVVIPVELSTTTTAV